MFFKRKKEVRIENQEDKEFQEASSRDLFCYKIHDKTYIYDPLQLYCALKEVGFDAFAKQLKGALSGNPIQTKIFSDTISKVFNVKKWTRDDDGLTVMEMADLYLKFFTFVYYLKKNYMLLDEFAPSMEQEWRELRTKKSENSRGSDEKATSSDSQNVSTPPQPREESQSSTEPEPPSME